MGARFAAARLKWQGRGGEMTICGNLAHEEVR